MNLLKLLNPWNWGEKKVGVASNHEAELGFSSLNANNPSTQLGSSNNDDVNFPSGASKYMENNFKLSDLLSCLSLKKKRVQPETGVSNSANSSAVSNQANSSVPTQPVYLSPNDVNVMTTLDQEKQKTSGKQNTSWNCFKKTKINPS